MDHARFDDLVKGLTRKIIMDKLIEDFEILQIFLIVRGGFPVVSYEAYVDLEVSIREMTEYDTTSVEQWRTVERFGKTKYILHPLKTGVARYGAIYSGLVVTKLILIK